MHHSVTTVVVPFPARGHRRHALRARFAASTRPGRPVPSLCIAFTPGACPSSSRSTVLRVRCLRRPPSGGAVRARPPRVLTTPLVVAGTTRVLAVVA